MAGIWVLGTNFDDDDDDDVINLGNKFCWCQKEAAIRIFH